MSDVIGKNCPYCKTTIQIGEPVTVCAACGMPHHESCWDENQGCTTFGCAKQHNLVQGLVSKHCSKCNAELQDSHAFCPQCGQKIELPVHEAVSSKISQYNDAVQNKKSKKPIVLGIVSVLVVIVIIGGIKFTNLFEKSPEFQEMFPECESKIYCEIASDGSYMMLDSNPNDRNNYYMKYVWESIEETNKALGFSSAFTTKMKYLRTTYGRWTESNDNYTVSWSYDPDSGLEVMYVKKDK